LEDRRAHGWINPAYRFCMRWSLRCAVTGRIYPANAPHQGADTRLPLRRIAKFFPP
jgi:hypothetical protein